MKDKDSINADALVLDANLRQSLVSVRSLGRRNLKVAALELSNVIERSKYIPAFTSRWCQQTYVAPMYEPCREPFIEYLKLLVTTTSTRVLITSSDGTLAVLREHRDEIEQWGTRIALAKVPALAAAINKDQTLEIAKLLGLGIPRGVMVKAVDEVVEAVHDVGLPAVVKPVETWLWGEERGVRLTCKLVTSLDEARLAVAELTENGGSTLFQQFLSGSREAVSLL